MMTNFMNAFVLLFPAVVAVVSAVPLAVRDGETVYAPPVLYPNQNTVWKVGDAHNVTWDISNAPMQITNPLGKIVLAKGGILNSADPLAQNFSILLGRIEVTVPNVQPGSDYRIVLIGDSGNFGEDFTITN